eukprot:TRINITY_DN8357_c0_g1_i1.p1 TRINITY_DN8357_c0_g1~~TRINITY_DN8357_c0_g1_i1.p1  ORF type:complete len:271 (+),score=56.66 TRINITY_DN8357_c0_g1_i1:318-1130(+)
MAANFWTSSHSQQLLDEGSAAVATGTVVNPRDQQLGLTAEDIRVLKIHFSLNIKLLAYNAKVRQRVVATATGYFRRLCAKKSFAEYDPRLVAPSCLYLASKAEECTVQAKVVVFYMKKLWPDGKYEIKDILEMEMRLVEALEFYLVIFHPYRPMVQYLQDLGLASELVQPCWSLLNDMYRGTDLCLMYAPYMLALGAIFTAGVLRDKDMRAWFEDLRIDLNEIRHISMELLDYYDKYRGITEERSGVPQEERVTAALAKLPTRGVKGHTA